MYILNMIEKFTHSGIINSKDIPLLEQYIAQKNKRIVFLDTTFVLPTSNENIAENFRNKHIPNALFFDIKAIANKSSSLPHMLPNKQAFEKAVSALGITNDDVIITYGQHGMIMGPARVWWMLKGFGHKDVMVLNGGLPAWIKSGCKTTSEQTKPLKPSQYKASEFKDTAVTDIIELKKICEECELPIIDARPKIRFNGQTSEPREGMRSGHIPNSKNLPCSTLVNDNGELKSKDELKRLFEKIGITSENQKQIITTCGSGITACALSLALHHIGQQNVSVYDGSWSEWGLEPPPT